MMVGRMSVEFLLILIRLPQEARRVEIKRIRSSSKYFHVLDLHCLKKRKKGKKMEKNKRNEGERKARKIKTK